MELTILKRQPWRFLACVLFLGVLMVAGLFFSLQTYIDSLNLAYAQEYYACIGTVMENSTVGNRYGSDRPELRPVSREALELLTESELVRQVDVRGALSGYIEGMTNVPLWFYQWNSSHLVILEGTAFMGYFDESWDPPGGDFYFRDITTYAGHPDWTEQIEDTASTMVSYTVYAAEGPLFEEGKRYLLLANTARRIQLDGAYTYLFIKFNILDQYAEESVLEKELYPEAVVLLDDDATAEDVLSIIQAKGWDKYVEQSDALSSVYTVRTTRNMNLLLPVSEEVMFYASGRGILPGDEGNRVCVISEELAVKHGLEVGDRIPLALADGAYTIAGYDTGWPMLGETLTLPFGDAENYEIIGTYAFTEHTVTGNPFLFSYNDIFIPADSEPDTANGRPYTLSFQVMGENYDEFMDTVVPQLERLGYTARLSSNKWEAVEDIYAQIEARRGGLLIAAVCTLLVCCLMYTGLVGLLYQREFALRKLLGTPEHLARRAYSVPFVASSLLGSICAVSVVQTLYVGFLRAQMELIVPENAPGGVQILFFLLAVAAAQAIVCFILLRLFCRWSERRAVRMLLK